MRKIYQKKKTSQLFSLFNKTPQRTTRQKRKQKRRIARRINGDIKVGQATADVKKLFLFVGQSPTYINK